MRIEVPANWPFLASGWQFSGLRTHVLVAAQRRWTACIVLVRTRATAADHSEVRERKQTMASKVAVGADARGLAVAFPTDRDTLC
jgi:hypothetical protein